MPLAIDSRLPRAHLFTWQMEDTAMHARSEFEESAEPPAGLAQILNRPRQVPLRGLLEKLSATLVTIFVQKKLKASEHDFPMGDQVNLPQELLEAVAQIAERNDRR